MGPGAVRAVRGRAGPAVPRAGGTGRRDRAGVVVDLGCGDGSLTATLAGAVAGGDGARGGLFGGDAGRRRRARDADRLTFAAGRIEDWQPDRPVDVLVSNAALHWVPGHRVPAPPARVGLLAPGGWLAVQMPGNADAPSHRLLTDLRRSPRWKDRLGPAGRWPRRRPRPTTSASCRVRLPRRRLGDDVRAPARPRPGARVDAGTALRPVYGRLSAEEAADSRPTRRDAAGGVPVPAVRHRAAVPPGLRGRAGGGGVATAGVRRARAEGADAGGSREWAGASWEAPT